MTSNGRVQSARLQFYEMPIKPKYSSLPETKHFTQPSSQMVTASKKWCFPRENLDSISAGLLLNSTPELSLAWEKHV